VATGGQSQGGITATGGTVASGGAATGGTVASGGAAAGGTSAGGSSAQGPCDIYQLGNTPCVAAHSTVRALYGAYNGNLYQVRRASDNTTKDIAVLSPGGYANSASQDTFCSGTTCTISVIYDQSPKGNHLKVTLKGGNLTTDGTEANATAAKVTANGGTVYGVYVTGSGVGYRNNAAQGLATGDKPESIYMVATGEHYSQLCCFDYGNAETSAQTGSPAGSMEAIYFGNDTQWGKGSGNGPWVMGDLEAGLFAGQSTAANASNTPLTAAYVTVMLKGDTSNHWALKGGSALSGSLTTMYDGPRPTGYNPMKKQGAIVLGVGGSNNYAGQGTFFEGCIVTGYPSDATDSAVQSNIVAAKYGG